MPMDSKENKKAARVGFTYAMNGIKEAIRTEINVKIHLIITVVVLVIGFFLQLNYLEWILLLLTISSVLAFELINTAIEKAMDYLAPEIHPLVGKVKDLSAGAVLIVAINALIVGLILFVPKLLELL